MIPKSMLVINETATLTENRVEKRGNKWCVVHAHPKKAGSKTDKPAGSIIKCFSTKKEASAMHRAIMASKAAAKNQEKNMKSVFSNIVLNLKTDKAQTRYDTLEGKQVLVVPCVMITEGVHNGSGGALYYPEKELAKKPAIWNGKPVVVYHPMMNGLSISACDPVVYETQKIGLLFNTRWDGKLKTECWIDEDKANEVDSRIMENIENGIMMEVSTGLFMDKDNVEGEWNGEAFNSTVYNYGPDHLAILPDQIGACSIEDGAGLLRNAKQEDTPEGRLANSLYKVFNELSHNEIWKEINNKINTGVDKNAWVVDVFDDYFIYEIGDKMFSQSYEIDKDDEIKLIGLREEVEKIVRYRLNDGTLIGNILVKVHKENKMNKEQIIDGLIENEKTPWNEDDREVLMGLTKEKLLGIQNQAKEELVVPAIPAVPEVPAVPAVVPKKEEKKEKEGTTENKEVTMEEYIVNAPKSMQGMLMNGVATYNAQKADLIKKITANELNTFTPEQLEKKDVNELMQLNAFIVVESVPAAPALPNFGGQAPLAPVENVDPVEEPLVMQPMSFDKEE